MFAPTISVVIATLNRGPDLCNTLSYFLTGEDHPSFELIVIDQSDNIDDATRELLVRYGARLNYVRREQKSLTASRNAGIALCKGRIVVFVDDDVQLFPGFLRAHNAAHADPDTWGATGPVYSLQDTAAGRLEAIKRELASQPLDAGPLSSVEWVPGCNMSFRRHVLHDIGGFDERYEIHCDDADISHRAKNAGGKLAFHPRAALIHLQNPSGGTRDKSTTPVRSNQYIRGYARSRIYFEWRMGRNPLRPWAMWKFARNIFLNHTARGEHRVLRSSLAFALGFADAFRHRKHPLLIARVSEDVTRERYIVPRG
ncbi:MAG TPA: glycosyltransferase [Pirellulales bacterium]|nr:glycosyltransferase [Pirellulales bacterium]